MPQTLLNLVQERLPELRLAESGRQSRVRHRPLEESARLKNLASANSLYPPAEGALLGEIQRLSSESSAEKERRRLERETRNTGRAKLLDLESALEKQSHTFGLASDLGVVADVLGRLKAVRHLLTEFPEILDDGSEAEEFAAVKAERERLTDGAKKWQQLLLRERVAIENEINELEATVGVDEGARQLGLTREHGHSNAPLVRDLSACLIAQRHIQENVNSLKQLEYHKPVEMPKRTHNPALPQSKEYYEQRERDARIAQERAFAQRQNQLAKERAERNRQGE